MVFEVRTVIKIQSFTVTGTITSFYCCSRFSGVGIPISDGFAYTHLSGVHFQIDNFITIKSLVLLSDLLPEGFSGKFNQ